MKFLKSISILGLSALAMMSVSSCIDDSDNLNPNEATDSMMQTDNLKTGAFFQQMLRSVAPWQNVDGNTASGDYEITQSFNYDALGGYVACLHSIAEWNSLYFFREQARKAMFDVAYVRIMSPWNSLHKLALEDPNMAILDAVATVAKVEGMHRAVDTYGPLPYVNYGSSNDYDAVDAIYAKFFDELDNAIETLEPAAAAGTKVLSDYDIVYAGDVAKWAKFANTLRLRLALRVVYADAALAQREAQKSLTSAVGLVAEQADRFEVNHNLYTYNHPYVEIMSWGEAAPAASIMAYMNGYSDPRLSAYFTAGADGSYNGVRVGLNVSDVSAYRNATNLSKLNVGTSAPIVLMYAAESYFLQAEAALRGWGGDAKTLYEQGVNASFSERNAGSAASYLASTATPGSFTDIVKNNNYTVTSTVTPAWDDAADFETKLEKIITQKWIAMYLEGCEAWSEYRRTGYPQLIPVVNNASGGKIDTNLGARRVPYPDQEYIDNAAAVAGGVRLLGGPDNGGTKLWWDKK